MEQISQASQFKTHRGQPLIGIILWENNQEVVHYFAEDADADAAIGKSAIQDALSLAGSWSDLSWDVVEKELYRIRHESLPTPPLDL